MKYHLMSYDRQQTGEYITKHLEYAGETREIFTDMAVNEIYKYSHGVARKINKLCTACLLHAAQIQKKIIDDHMVILIIEEEFNW